MGGVVVDELKALRSLARAMGVHTRYVNGLGKHVTVAPETLVRVCAALGAPVERPSDAAGALRAHRETASARLAAARAGRVGRSLVLPISTRPRGPVHGKCIVRTGRSSRSMQSEAELRAARTLPAGYHRLTVETRGRSRDLHRHCRTDAGVAPARGRIGAGGSAPIWPRSARRGADHSETFGTSSRSAAG